MALGLEGPDDPNELIQFLSSFVTRVEVFYSGGLSIPLSTEACSLNCLFSAVKI